MKGLQRSILAGALGLVTAIQVQAGEVSLFDFAFNIDGVVTSQASPAGVSIAGFDTGTGLGTITVSLGGVGPHYVGLFVDHEIDETTNTFFNEHGATSGGALAIGWRLGGTELGDRRTGLRLRRYLDELQDGCVGRHEWCSEHRPG